MKKITLFIFLLLLLSNFAKATDSLRAYYSTVAKAEWAVCESDVSQAASLYRSAFSYKAKPFYTDLLQALNCELQLEDLDTVTCEHYFKQILLKRGWHAVERKNADNFLNPYKSGRLGDNFEKLINRYFSSDTNVLQHQIMSMFNEDQRVRREAKYLDTCDGNRCDKNIVYTDSINNLKLLKLLQTNPEILNENVVGFFGIFHIRGLLMHHTYTSFDANGYLLQAVKDGIFDARLYASLFDRYYMHVLSANDTTPTGVFSDDYYGTWNLYNFLVPENNKSLSLIFTDERNRVVKNSRRSKIFLEDVLDSSYRKFRLQDKGGRKDTFTLCEEQLNSMLNNFKNQNIQFDYYIPNEKDFDFNFKRTE
jgi:hypothetical protein